MCAFGVSAWCIQACWAPGKQQTQSLTVAELTCSRADLRDHWCWTGRGPSRRFSAHSNMTRTLYHHVATPVRQYRPYHC